MEKMVTKWVLFLLLTPLHFEPIALVSREKLEFVWGGVLCAKKGVFGMAIAALVLGIISLVLSVISFFLLGWLCFIALALGILAIVFACVVRKKGEKATGGLVCGIIGTSISSIWSIVYIILIALAISVAGAI